MAYRTPADRTPARAHRYSMSVWDPVAHFLWAWEDSQAEGTLKISMDEFLFSPAQHLPRMPAEMIRLPLFG